MVIVEGPDGAGKSTLVKELQEYFPHLLTGERGVSDRDKLWEVTRSDTYRAISEALTSENPHIWDRLFWSEFAYHPITSRECQFSAVDRRRIPQLLSVIGAPVIWCMPPFRVVQENIAKTHQMSGVAEHIEDIYRMYHTLREDPFLRVSSMINYDYTSKNADERRSYIKGYVEAYLETRNPACASPSITSL